MQELVEITCLLLFKYVQKLAKEQYFVVRRKRDFKTKYGKQKTAFRAV